MTKRTIGRGGEDSELSLLALLEQLHSDRAAGLYRDLTAYCAANPELSDAFLELAQAAEWEEWEETKKSPKSSQLPEEVLRSPCRSLPACGELWPVSLNFLTILNSPPTLPALPTRPVLLCSAGEWLRTGPATAHVTPVSGRTCKADRDKD